MCTPQDQELVAAANALRTLLRSNPRPEKISTDMGKEFSGAFAQLLDVLKIDHAVKDPRDRTILAVMERGIMTLKRQFGIAREQGQDWVTALARVVEQYNKDPLSTTGVAPGEVATNEVGQFFIERNMAQSIKHNVAIEQKREVALD